MARDEISDTEARARIAAQLPIDEKVRRANYVIWTDGPFEETNRQVRATYEALVSG
jgi:dephospho-CoA kinase